eukprot:CAMPEP_0172741110 /NCGR_PEP_ID=MMETSP1074-20121228/126405_1 /TAXON_ID=2916 /ORGANISM="Ceratium fusus, Strain PA161109" /LENGTH=114 /DNA_ID=CAMNT_0013571361 /DNA_START=9 /DNA_END=354 /DNA_ORIENTATION=-
MRGPGLNVIEAMSKSSVLQRSSEPSEPPATSTLCSSILTAAQPPDAELGLAQAENATLPSRSDPAWHQKPQKNQQPQLSSCCRYDQNHQQQAADAHPASQHHNMLVAPPAEVLA